MLKAGPSTNSGQAASKPLNPYARRIRDEYRRRWPELHAKTVERVKKATANLQVAEYFAGDCREFLAHADAAGKLVGAFGVSQPRGFLPCDVYLMADFAVRPTPHRRLSKRILACLLSREVRADVEQWL